MDIVDLPPETSKWEWPTICLALVIYGLWAATTWYYEILPFPVFVILGAWSVAWHMSLQHEVIHGHPTKWRGLNNAIALWPLALWLPYESYRRSHLQHHNDNRLTDPLDDPESYYWTEQQWQELGGLGRALVRAQSTLLGRMVIGPAWAMIRFWWNEANHVAAGDVRRLRFIATHAAQLLVVLVWVEAVCGIPFWTYFFACAYFGTSLALVRSFAEHRAEQAAERRTAIVENSRILGVLFLFNNLHVAHHMRAQMPWYRSPRWYRLNRAALIERNGGLVYESYFDVARRYLFKPHDQPLHPIARGRRVR